MPPRVNVVLLNWNNIPDTLDCISQLRLLTYPQDKIEIIVVDNGSTDNSREILSAQENITTIFLPKNEGFASGTNAGIKAALATDCKFLLVINNDTILPAEFLSPLVDVLEDNPTIGIVSPKIYYSSNTETIWFAGGKFTRPRILGSIIGLDELDEGRYEQPRLIDFAVGCCMLIKREVFEKVGYFDEDFFFYHEDVDFCYRAQSKGIQIFYQPKSIIYHKVSQSTNQDIPKRVYLHNQARMIFLTKHIRGFSIFFVVLLEIIRTCRIFFSYLFANKPDFIRAYLSGLVTGFREGIHNRLEPRDLATGQRKLNLAIRKKFRFTLRIFGLIILITIFTFLIIRALRGIKVIVESGITFHPEFLALSFLCQFIGVLLAALVWSDILRELGIKSDYFFDLQAFCVSALTRKIPGFVVYAVSRILIYEFKKASKIRVTIGMLVELAMTSLGGMVCLAFVVGFSLLPGNWTRQGWIIGIFILLIALLACFLSPYLIRYLLRFSPSGSDLEQSSFNQPVKFYDTLRWIFGESLVILLATGVVFFALKAIEVNAYVPFIPILGAISLTVSIGPFVVWLPGDIGLRDGLMYLAIKPSLGPSVAALATLVARIWISLLEIIFGLVASIFLSRNVNIWKKKK
jgi:GT2 family glycosyltransferase